MFGRPNYSYGHTYAPPPRGLRFIDASGHHHGRGRGGIQFLGACLVAASSWPVVPMFHSVKGGFPVGGAEAAAFRGFKCPRIERLLECFFVVRWHSP